MGTSLQRWLVIALGALLIIVGLIIGRSSYQVAYQSLPAGVMAHYITGDNGKGYLQMAGSTALYVVYEQDLSPTFNADDLGDGNISLIYRPDDTMDIDVTSTAGTHLTGKAYKVIEITVYGGTQQAYATSEYRQFPDGFFQNNWEVGSPLIGVGAAIILLAFFIARRIFTVAYYMFAGALLLPFGFFVFIGFEIGFDLASIKTAFMDDLTLAIVLALIGAAIGLIVGIVQAIRGKDAISQFS